MQFGLRIFAVLVVLAATTRLAPSQPAIHNVTWTPHQIETGSPCLFKVELTATPTSLHAQWQGHDVAFFPVGTVWYGLAGVDVEAKPGEYNLTLTATYPDGKTVQDEHTVGVVQAPYKSEKLRVPDRYVQPNAETLRRIAADKEIKQAAFAHDVAEAEWSGQFEAPVENTVSDGFGTRRILNGKLATIHRGLDYHAKMGTPVLAANSGEVVLARELFYEGNCVILDHGQRFMTLYMHLSHLAVAEGEKVKKGQQIGLSGATGRATGPHLHMAVRWEGAYLDPVQLLALPLPDTKAASDARARSK